MTTQTFDVIDGIPVADLAHLASLDVTAALARKREVELRLSALKAIPPTKQTLEEREALKRENVSLDARLRDLREEAKRENMRRNFAGIGSPLHEALVERYPADVVRELECVAIAKLTERERRNAERRASRAERKEGST